MYLILRDYFFRCEVAFQSLCLSLNLLVTRTIIFTDEMGKKQNKQTNPNSPPQIADDGRAEAWHARCPRHTSCSDTHSRHPCEAWPSTSPFSSHLVTVSCLFLESPSLPLSFLQLFLGLKSILHSLLFLKI